MKLAPVKDWVVARAIIVKRSSSIIIGSSGSNGVTRCYLLEEVSKKAEEQGYKTGDIVVSVKVFDMKLFREQRVTFPTEEIFMRIEEASLDDFTDLDGKPLVPEKQPARSAEASA